MLDAEADSEFDFAEPLKSIGFRTLLGVPLLRKGQPIDVFVLMRKSVKPFTDKQIALVQNFAAQAVIAIENARLLNELRESFQQQIATADVLKVISTSPGELEPVFQAMLENALRSCSARKVQGSAAWVLRHVSTVVSQGPFRETPQIRHEAKHLLSVI